MQKVAPSRLKTALINSLVFIAAAILITSASGLDNDWSPDDRALFSGVLGAAFVATTIAMTAPRLMLRTQALFVTAATLLVCVLGIAASKSPLVNSNYGLLWLGTIALCLWWDRQDRAQGDSAKFQSGPPQR